MTLLLSPAGDLELPAAKNLTEFMLKQIEGYGEKIAVIDAKLNKQLTFLEIATNIRATAFGFLQLGIQPGDVICMFTPNCVEYYYVFYAVAMIKAVITTANPNLTKRELCHQLKTSSAKWIIVAPNSADVGQQAMKDTGLDIHNMLCIGQQKLTTIKNFDEILQLGQLEDGDYDGGVLNDVFNLPFSSGTTGLSKGCKCKQLCFVANIIAHCHPLFQHIHHKDIVVTFLPFYHVYAQLTALTLVLWMGSTNVIMDKFNLDTYCGLISKHRATVSHLVPTVAVLLAKSTTVDKYDLSSMRVLVSGSAVLKEEIELQIKNRLAGIEIWQLFGMTEIGISFSPTINGHKSGSVGMICQGYQVKVVCLKTGDVISANQEGEIWIKGPGVMEGYVNRNYAECFTEDGWFRTGDVGYFDTDEYFFITDRVKDLIKYKGHQIAPAELESLLLSHPSVADAAVIGIPHSTAGELPKAYVVLKPGHTVSTLAIKEFIAEQVAYYKQLRGGVQIIDTIPKSNVGKILKKRLREKSRTVISHL